MNAGGAPMPRLDAAPMGPAQADPRPRIALRVGITGHRDISRRYGDNYPAIEAQLAAALATIRSAAEAIAAADRGRGAYRDAPPLLRMISPLAEGADRIAAEIASRLGYRLLAPLPFAQAEYENDFDDESKAEFRRLLARAEAEEGVIALDGGRGTPTGDQSYDAVGRFVTRGADIMIAIWERGRWGGMGGTGDIVAFALRSGVPVLWIPPDAPAGMRLLVERDALELPAPPTSDALAELKAHAAALLEPPPLAAEGEAPPGGGWHGLAERWRRLPFRAGPPLRQFYDERPRISKGPMLAFDRFRRLLAFPQRKQHRLATVSAPSAVRVPLTPAQLEKIAAYERIRDRVGDLALFYSHCHRSTFLALFGLGAAALCSAGLAIVWGLPFVLLELASLGAVGWLVAMDRARRWHDRWIDYRILAELMRQMAYLVLLGRTFPIKRAAILSSHGARTVRRQDWVLWYFSAVVREVGVPAARFEPDYLRGVRERFVDGLLAEQIEYHLVNGRRAGTIARRLGAVGLLCFAGSVLAALVKIAILSVHGTYGVEWLGVLGVTLPALSAAAFALRAQAEFEIVAKNSEHLHRRLDESAGRLRRLALGGPLSSAHLADGIYGAGAAMIADVEDWVALFDVKTAELS